jgi:hypothetical protein
MGDLDERIVDDIRGVGGRLTLGQPLTDYRIFAIYN